jgi:elongation factor Ts
MTRLTLWAARLKTWNTTKPTKLKKPNFRFAAIGLGVAHLTRSVSLNFALTEPAVEAKYLQQSFSSNNFRITIMADISAKAVKELREATGAGMMDCKKALVENGGDMEKSVEWLRQKGMASADKKAGKVAAEGLVGQYIHTGGRIGVLVEVNCQTDFVARNEAFKELVNNVAMQIAACPNVEYVRQDDIPADVVEREKAVEMGKDDLGGKKAEIKEKIVAGRIEKRLKEMCLLDQPYIKDQDITVADLVKQQVAALGENIQVRRFSRFVLGEGIEVEETDFAAEVAAQAAGNA